MIYIRKGLFTGSPFYGWERLIMKSIKRICAAFCAILIAAMIAAGACTAEEAPIEDGLYTIGVYSSSRMFKVTECVLHVWDGRMTAVITLSGDGYGYVYAGDAQEAAAAPVEEWIPYAVNWNGKYTYAVPIDRLDAEISVAGYSKRYEKWYDRTLIFHSNTIAQYAETAPDGVYAGTISSNGALDGKNCVLTSRDGDMTLKTEDGFSMELPSLDRRVEIAGAEGEWIMLPAKSMEEYVVCAPDGVYQAEVATDSALLRFESCTIKAEGGKMTAILKTKNGAFQYIYIGTAADAAQDADRWIPGILDEDGGYTYVVSVPTLDNDLQIATYSEKKNMWYDRTMFIDSASLIPE